MDAHTDPLPLHLSEPSADDSPSADELRMAYRVAVRSRSLEEHIVRAVSRGEVPFAIWGPGEEVHGAATAMALFHAGISPERFGLVPHYRSASLVAMWAELNDELGVPLAILRQQFARATDEMSYGRQMVNHFHLPELGVLPAQSPVGMQLGKAAGYARGFQVRGIADGVTMAVLGDGSTAEGDMHDAMNAASVWSLPLIVLVTDNSIAISTTPSEGRGIKDFRAYAHAFGFEHVEVDGRDFFDTWQGTLRAARMAREEQRPVLIHARHLPRFNGHSSAADVTYDLSQADPLIRFGRQLLDMGLLDEEDLLVRKEGQGRDFFAHHRLGRVMEAEDEEIRALFARVRGEPEPTAESLFDHVRPSLPQAPESRPGPGRTNVSYAGAIRSALGKLIQRRGGVVQGQDVGRLGGVMQASAGLKAAFPERVVDAPLNEPLILGTATGMALHDELMALPEIQFGDYSLNAFHWLVHLGNLYWTSKGHASAKLVLRMPVDPFGGGAIYHSMSVDGYFSPIPGLVILMPSTSFDAHGLLLSAGDYDGPVVMLEPKWMYRQTLGPAFPGEPPDAEGIRALKKGIMRGDIPDLPDVHVPIGKAAVRRAGDDVTIVAWGRAVWTAMKAADQLETQGIEAEVIDLRTLVPPDLDTVIASVGRTGRLVVAAEDRAFAGFVRSIQGAVVEALPGTPTRALGQLDLPGISANLHQEEQQVLLDSTIVQGVRDVLGVKVAGATRSVWVPPRYFVS